MKNVIEARKRLVNILSQTNQNEISQLKIVKMLIKKTRLSEKKSPKYKIFMLIILIVVILFTSGVLTKEGFSKMLSSWQKVNIHEQKCTINMPDLVNKVTRPPVSCRICDNITQVDRITNISPDAFENLYAYSGKPVVVADAMKNWTAQQVFSFSFFKKLYETRMNDWSKRRCQFFPYSTEFKSLSQVLNMSEERALMLNGTKPWYVGWSNCDDEITQILRTHYEKPYFLPATAESKRLDWIFMGSKGYGAPMHIDNVEHPSWQAQLKGSKRWILQPPPECFYSCQSFEVILEPGEIIVIDTNIWYHSTMIVSDDISITIGAEYD